MIDLREKLRPLIAEIGQAETARRSQISQGNISAWLAGKRNMPFETQCKLAEALNQEVLIETRPLKSPKPRSPQSQQ